MDPQLIGTLVDVGMTGIMVFFLSKLWDELRVMVQFMRDLILRQQAAEEERDLLKSQIEDLQYEAYGQRRPSSQSNRNRTRPPSESGQNN